MDRPQQEGRTADPIGQRRTVEFDALAGVDLSLPIQRKMIGIFGDKHLRYRGLGWQSAFDKPGRRWRLHHHVLTSPAAIFGSPNHQHAELCRHDVEPFADILADPMQGLAAARASAVYNVDHHLDARQMFGKRSFVHPTLSGPVCPLRWIGRFRRDLLARRSLLDVFEPEQHLIFGQRLGAATEAMTLQFLDDLTQPFVLHPLRNQHRLERTGIVGKRICHNRHGAIRPCAAPRREHFCPADSLCRNHPGCIGAGISRAA